MPPSVTKGLRLGQIGLLLLLSFLLIAACIARVVHYPSEGDARIFRLYAFAFREQGFLSDFGSIRTYGYAAFLYVLTFLSGRDHDALAVVAGAAQYALLAASTIWLGARLAVWNRRLAWSVLVGLLLNPLVAGLAADSLSDALPLAALPLLVGLALVAGQSERRAAVGFGLLGAGVVAFAFMVRPSSVILLLAWHLAVVAGLWLRPGKASARLGAIGGYIIGAILLTAALFAPQALYNMRVWGQATVLPVCELGQLQAVFGVAGLRYDAMILNGALTTFTYPNPFFDAGAPPGGLGWYFRHPGAGVATMAGHLFLAHSVNSLFTYVYDGFPSYSLPLLVIAWSVIVVGLVGAVLGVAACLRGRDLRIAQPVLFVATAVMGITALNAISAVELRYNVPVIAVLSVLACSLILQIDGRRRWMAIAAAVMIAVPAAFLSDQLARGGHLGFPTVAGFDLAAARCVLWKAPPTPPG